MSTNATKNLAAPPSYEEVMHIPSGGPVIGIVAGTGPPPPSVGIIYPNAGVGVGMQQPPPIATAPMPPPGYVPSYGAFETTPVSVVVQPTVAVPSEIIVIGGCPACRIGYLEDSYSCLGLLCAIAFFPVGILCCLAMKTKRCSNCGSEF